MPKLDFRKQQPALFSAPTDEFVLIKVPRLRFIKVDGQGDPNAAPAYARALEWLYSVSFGTKFAAKADGNDYVVPPLQGLWWADSPKAFTSGQRDKWQWTMMIMVPDFVTDAHYQAGVAKATKKLGEPPDSLRLEESDEGLAVQILHLGSYADEAPTIKRLHEEFLPANGLVENGPHHEIYLSDPRRVEAAKLKTILRQPVKQKAAKKPPAKKAVARKTPVAKKPAAKKPAAKKSPARKAAAKKK